MIVNDFFRSLLKCLIEINYKWKKLKNFLQNFLTKTACDSKLYLLNTCIHAAHATYVHTSMDNKSRTQCDKDAPFTAYSQFILNFSDF